MEVDDGIVVYDSATGRFADLNTSAAQLWVVLEAADWSATALEQHLERSHEMPPDEAREVLAGFLVELERALPRPSA